jgi:hypothetical protein
MENKQEISKFFKKYFKREKELGAAPESEQLFRTLESGYQIFIDRFSHGYPRKVSVSNGDLGSLFCNPEPSDLVNLVRETFPADSKVEIVLDEHEVADYNRQLEKWRNKGDLRANVNLTLEYKPTKVGDKEFEGYIDSIKSEAEQIRKEFWSHEVEFSYPKYYKLVIDGKEFMNFNRWPAHFGIILKASAINFDGTPDEIVKFAETLDKAIVASYPGNKVANA